MWTTKQRGADTSQGTRVPLVESTETETTADLDHTHAHASPRARKVFLARTHSMRCRDAIRFTMYRYDLYIK